MEEKKAKVQVLANELAETKSKKQEFVKKGVAVAGMAAVVLSSFEMGKAQGLVDEEAVNDDVAHVATATHETDAETQNVLIVDAISDEVDVEDIDDIVIAEPELSSESNQIIDTQIAENTTNVSEAELVYPDSDPDIDDILPNPNVEDIDDGIISDCIQDDLMA